MLFADALSQLEEGKALCRAAWSLEDGYLVFMKGMQHVWKIVLQPQPNAGNYIFSVADFKADDWKTFELPAQPAAVVEGEVVA